MERAFGFLVLCVKNLEATSLLWHRQGAGQTRKVNIPSGICKTGDKARVSELEKEHGGSQCAGAEASGLETLVGTHTSWLCPTELGWVFSANITDFLRLLSRSVREGLFWNETVHFILPDEECLGRHSELNYWLAIIRAKLTCKKRRVPTPTHSSYSASPKG